MAFVARLTIKVGKTGGFADPAVALRGFSNKMQKLILQDAANGIHDEIVIGANNIRNEMILSMRDSPATGRRYSRGGGKFHIASSPGFPPRVDTGDLIGSIVMDDRKDEIEVGSRITDPPYPKYLEQGTKKMDARPWRDPAFNKERPSIERNIVQAVVRAARRAKNR